MKEVFKRTAYRRWKKKGLVTKDKDGNEFLDKDSQQFKLTFSEGKVFLNNAAQQDLNEEGNGSKWNKENAKKDSFFNKKVSVSSSKEGECIHQMKSEYCAMCMKRKAKKDKGRKKSKTINVDE